MNNFHFTLPSWIYALIVIFLFINKGIAQIDLNAYSGGYIQVNNYNGVTSPNLSKIQFNLHANANLANWTLSVRFPNPIVTSTGKRFPIEKLKLRINHIEGNIQGVSPTVATLGANPNSIPMQITDVDLIRNSPFKLQTPQYTYNQFVIYYDVSIDGGAYLQDFNGSQITGIPCIVTLKDANGATIHQTSLNNYNLHFMLNGVPPIENTYSLEINAMAKNSFLEFNTLTDYINGVQVYYEKALKVISSTPYSIQVRSTSGQLTANRSELPIGIVNLSIFDSNTLSNLGNVDLSNSFQTLYHSNSVEKQGRFFNLKYATKAQDQRILDVKPDTYSTTLIYTLTPQ